MSRLGTRDGYTKRTRDAVDKRDGFRCQRCGRICGFGMPLSRQHRKPRKMGGANRADAGRLSNVLTLCGSATTPGSCHLWAESERNDARAAGWLLYDSQDPAEVPVVDTAGRRWLYDDEGGRVRLDDGGAS